MVLVGPSVSQLGFVDSSTSVSLNGRIDLLADYNAVSAGGLVSGATFFPQATGTVTFGPESVTRILPELADTATVVGTQLALASQLTVHGQAVHLAGNATIQAPDAAIEIDAGGWNFTGAGTGARDSLDFLCGQIYLDSGAVIDASGSSDVAAAISENIVSAQLLGTELANDPLLRDGPLRGQTIQVDIRQTGTYNGQTWVGTPLADISGYIALIQRTVGELTTSGGSVSLNAGGSVVVQSGATINVSGGSIAYQGGVVQTTDLVAGGRIYNVSTATPDRVYDGLYTGSTSTDTKWGIVTTSTTAQFGGVYEAGYLQGGNGGSIAITAPAMALDGSLVGRTAAGPWQRVVAPTAAALSLVFQGQDQSLPANSYPAYSPTPPAVSFSLGAAQAAPAAFSVDASGTPAALGGDRTERVFLSPSLIGSGNFGRLTIDNSDGSIAVATGTGLTLPSGGALALTAASIDIEGSIDAPGGTLGFTALDVSPYANRALTGGAVPVTPTPDPSRGQFTLGSAASLDVAGLIVDDRSTSSSSGSLPMALNGGAVTVRAYSASLASGAVIDVSGGLGISAVAKLTYGSGGAIAISAGEDPLVSSVLGGQLQLYGTLRGYAGSKGGALSLLAPSVQIGGTSSNASTLLLSPSFFTQGGFGTYAISGIGAQSSSGVVTPGLVVAPGTLLEPTEANWVEVPTSGADGTALLQAGLLPSGVRSAVNLTLSAPGARNPYNSASPIVVLGDLVVSEGATVRTDPGGSVTLSGDTVAVLGAVIAPGGSVKVSGGKDSTVLFQNSSQAVPTVDLGPASLLSAAGATLLTPDPRGYRTGSVLPGGTISVSGNIVAESGAVINVSGASDTLFLAPSYSGYANLSPDGLLLVPTRVDSSGGSIILSGAQELFEDATLLGAAGGASALGGGLTVSSGRFYPAGSSAGAATPLDSTLVVTQSGATLPARGSAQSGVSIGNPVTNAAGQALQGQGYIAADRFSAGGFDSVTLAGTVQFKGPVVLSAPQSLKLGTSGVITADSSVSLSAPYISLGMPFQAPESAQQQVSAFQVQGQPFFFAPAYGSGSLSATARLIDVGNLSLQSIGNAILAADGGDIRGDGTLDIAGSILLRAGQIYPPTEVVFNIVAYDSAGSTGQTRQGSVTIVGAGDRPLPLSAGGTLNILGSTINQGGVLRAPIGTINLGWDGVGAAPSDPIAGSSASAPVTRQLNLTAGSLTSVSAVDPSTGQAAVIPYGLELNGTAWIDPAGTDITAGGAPSKAIRLSAVTVSDQAGSTIDLRGGGDLFAYQWVSGTGGTQDVLASLNSFAVIPGYAAAYAPYGPYNTAPLTTNLGSDVGYANAKLTVGGQVYLNASPGLPAGIYTLLPARYALLHGAFLVTPQSGIPPAAAAAQPDGSTVVSGYVRYGLGSSMSAPGLYAAFSVASSSVLAGRAQYAGFSADASLAQGAAAAGSSVPRLPVDSGQLVVTATLAMQVRGSVAAQAPAAGLGGLIDIDSPVDIVIGTATTAVPAGVLELNSADLSAFGAESLLVGGIRQQGSGGISVQTDTGSLTVNNAGQPLSGSDIILVASRSLVLSPGADVEQAGSLASGAESLLLGSSSSVGSGNGLLLRVSASASAPVTRASVDGSTSPALAIGAGANLAGANITVDSTGSTSLDPSASLAGSALFVGSRQIALQLNGAPSIPSGSGMLLSLVELQRIQSAQAISLRSYSSIDIYGSGQIGALSASGAPLIGSLTLNAAEIRGFAANGGTVAFNAQSLVLSNTAGGSAPGPSANPNGTLTFNAGTVTLGAGALAVDQYTQVSVAGTAAILTQGAGSLSVQGGLSLSAPLITAAVGATESVVAGGALSLGGAGVLPAAVTPGLGATLAFAGATISESTSIILPSGQLSLHSTAGDLTITGSARLDVGGVSTAFYDTAASTPGGAISLAADAGSVTVASGAVVTVAAPSSTGSAGSLSVSATGGSFSLGGTLLGTGSAGASFSLDAGSLPGGMLGSLDSSLNAGGFSTSRAFRIRLGDVTVDGLATAKNFVLSADSGSINVTGTIDGTGLQGGSISLAAAGSVTLLSGAVLTVAAQNFDDAGKGGAISLEAGADVNATASRAGFIDVRSGSKIDLSVAGNTTGSGSLGQVSGTLTLRAPASSDGSDIQIRALNGSITGASGIVVLGESIYNVAGAAGTITPAVQASILADGTALGSHAAAIAQRLLPSGGPLADILHIRPGAQVVNPLGDLTLGSPWDLSAYRFGPSANPLALGSGEPGELTLRAAGNLVFADGTNPLTGAASRGSLSDGFGGTSQYGLWDAPVLPAGSLSWSYRLVAGADFAAADFSQVRPIATLSTGSGSLLLGSGSPPLPLQTSATRSAIIPSYYQVIRTGTGDITIAAGRDVQLLNPLATIYTAGTAISNPTTVVSAGDFSLPNLSTPIRNSKLGPSQVPYYGAYYTVEGGNLSISAQGDIVHQLAASDGTISADSSKEMPTDWLYRRGYIDPATGQFGATHAGGEIESTSWWVDFSNFFEGVGALGGGNVVLSAGRDVSNVDAAVVTNTRMAQGVPSLSSLVELGGGDLVVQAGRNINAGVYYVERGQGTLAASGSILTNSTRAALTQYDIIALQATGLTADSTTWLPTTLFLGNGSFNVSAGGGLLLGPVANPFLLPQGLNNNAYDKSYFSTYATTDKLSVSSLTGSVALKDNSYTNSGTLSAWYQNVLLYDPAQSRTYSSYSQPWLRLAETSADPFATDFALMPASLVARAFSGDIDLIGGLVLSPSPTGTVDLAASGSINGLQVNGQITFAGKPVNVWASSAINLSDADPSRIPSAVSPLSLSAAAALTPSVTPTDLMASVDPLFNESGSTEGTYGVIQTKQALHAPGPLHALDPNPVRLYAKSGNVSGLTLFAGKAARVVSGGDITDVAFYLQNNQPGDLTVIAAGRDVIAYDPNSALRTAAQAAGNELEMTASTEPGPGSGNANAGDIQLGGPGTLEVLAGRNLTLGVGPNALDGTAVGITTIGNARNPFLGFAGASVIAGAGIGAVSSLQSSKINFAAFEGAFLDPATAGSEAGRYLPQLGALMDLAHPTSAEVWSKFRALSAPERDRLDLDLFYLVLRDAGRDHNNAASAGFGTYASGFSAISAVFPGSSWGGDLSLTSREVKTESGGDISLFAPGGSLTVGIDLRGNQPIDQGLLTEDGGNISIFARGDVNVGTSRIFTLRGGNEIIWSSTGSIAAGASSKTVQSAPPTRVLIDPQSADVKTDLAGLATGGGIGVLVTVAGVPPGDVDLVAPGGTIDAGDAGIRVSGNLNISAVHVLNTSNIQVSGASAGAVTAVAPSLGGLLAAASTSAAGSAAANALSPQDRAQAAVEVPGSLITVEVIGYGGADDGTTY